MISTIIKTCLVSHLHLRSDHLWCKNAYFKTASFDGWAGRLSLGHHKLILVILYFDPVVILVRALYRRVVWSKLSQSGASFLLHSIEGLNGAHVFVIGFVYLIKTAFWAFLNSLPDRFARVKIAIFAPIAFICPLRRQPIYWKAYLYIKNLLKVSPNLTVKIE